MTRPDQRPPFPIVKVLCVFGFLAVVVLARGWVRRYASITPIAPAKPVSAAAAPSHPVKPAPASPSPLPPVTHVQPPAETAAAPAPAAAKPDVLNIRAILPEWKGVNSGVRDPRTVIVESADMWQALWTEHTAGMQPMPPLPDVDFSRNLVIGVFAGQKATAGYGIEIIETRASPTSLTVLYRETIPDTTAIPAQTPTQPYHLEVIPKSNLLIQFKKV
jgi:hypothetical protein